MSFILIYYILIFSLGFVIYIRKPRHFFLYWLSVPAFVVPLFFIMFKPSYVGEQTFETFYLGFRAPLSYLLIVITILEFFKTKQIEQKVILIPFLILLIFLIVQNFLKGFNAGAIIINLREALFLMLPTLALSISPRLWPRRNELIRFLVFYIAIQLFFCILNKWGISVYSSYTNDSSFADNYFSGTFFRYNHLTNYLTTFYLFISTAYFVNKIIPKFGYIVITVIVGAIIMLSGARISVILFLLTIGLFLLLYRRKHIVLLSIIAIVVAYVAPLLSSKYNVGTANADQATGFERNVTGLTDLFETKSIEDNTLALSGFLLLTKFGDPLMGNGYAYRNTYQYEFSETITEVILQTDARMAFMIVEYGIIGCLCYVFFFYGIIKCNRIQLGINSQKLWTILIMYYVAFTFTETGMFDLIPFSMLSIYCFSR